MRVFLPVLLALGTAPAFAGQIDLDIEIPRLNVAEYHRPYVAVWVEGPDKRVAANLAVWYAGNLRNNEGVTWLKDLRQWWRRIGREVDVPIDGVTSATRAPGRHQLSFSEGSAPLGKLAPGNYRLQVEAAREVGGRELLGIDFTWPPKQGQQLKIKGEHELGQIVLTLKP